jgi:CelD/BcsL family acetyltransferase involved in cellulose biosynthesis
MQQCLEQIAQYQVGGCVPVLSTLTLDGEWAALHLGVRAGSVLHYWLPIYNRKFRSLSPGMLLLQKIIESARANAVDEIDFGGQVSRYKELFATENYPLYRSISFQPRLRGLAYHGYLSLAWRLRSMFPGLPELPGSSLP